MESGISFWMASGHTLAFARPDLCFRSQHSSRLRCEIQIAADTNTTRSSQRNKQSHHPALTPVSVEPKPTLTTSVTAARLGNGTIASDHPQCICVSSVNQTLLQQCMSSVNSVSQQRPRFGVTGSSWIEMSRPCYQFHIPDALPFGQGLPQTPSTHNTTLAPLTAPFDGTARSAHAQPIHALRIHRQSSPSAA